MNDEFDPAEVERGRFSLLAAMLVTLIGDALVIMARAYRFGVDGSGSSAVRWLLSAAIFYFAFRGQEWARWLMVGLLALGLMLALPAGFHSQNPLFIGLVLQFSIALGYLAFTPSISVFQKYQRSRYRETNN